MGKMAVPADLLQEMEANKGLRQEFTDEKPPRQIERPAAIDVDDGVEPAPSIFYPQRDWPFRGTLREHQLRALGEADLKPGHAFWLDPGAGKTGLCIAEASHLWVNGEIDGMLILAPNGPHQQWITEQFPQWCQVPWHGAHNKMSKTMLDKNLFAKKSRGLYALSVNYDTLRMRNGQDLINRFFRLAPRIYLAVDESSKLKNPKAARTEGAVRIAQISTYRRMLSGTPILKGLEDLYTQYDMVERGITGFRNYFAYRNYYCALAPVPGSRNPKAKRIVGYRNEQELRERTAPYATRVKASEFMKGDEPDFNRVLTPMGGEQSREYRRMQDTLIAEIDSGTVTAQNALVRIGKLQQLASGFIIDEEGKATVLGRNKIDATIDLIGDLDENVIIFTSFRWLQAEIDRALREEFPDRHVYLYENRDTVEAWKRTGGILQGNQASGLGIGQNLQDAAASIYTTNPFAAEARWQSLKRTDRMGQTKHVRYWDLITPDTVDVEVLASLSAKEDVARRNIDGLRELIRR